MVLFTLTPLWVYYSLKWYSLALTKYLFNLLALRNKTMDRGVNTLFTSLSTCKILRFLSVIAWRDFSKGCYVTTYGIPFILWCLSLLFNLSWKTFFISELVRSSGCSIFQNHNFIYSLWFSKPFSDVHNLQIREVCPRTTDFLVQYGWADS